MSSITSTLAESNLAAITRFQRIARRGRAPGASSGEIVAHQLAKAIHNLGDDLALLDPSAIRGACILIQAASGPWPTDESKDAIFQTIRDCVS